jgi:hypothetical protein
VAGRPVGQVYRPAPSSAPKVCAECGCAVSRTCPRCGCLVAAAANCSDGGISFSPNHGLEAKPLAGAIFPSQAPERRQLTVMFCDLVGSTALSLRRAFIDCYRRALHVTRLELGGIAGTGCRPPPAVEPQRGAASSMPQIRRRARRRRARRSLAENCERTATLQGFCSPRCLASKLQNSAHF